MTPLQFQLAQASDLHEILEWPPYPPAFSELDYALRERGWIHEFYRKPHVSFYVAKQAQQTIGFSLLAKTADAEAEFRVALHPDKLGMGLGKMITLQTLTAGFTHLALSRIYLIVRVSNVRAIQLYQSLGFGFREQTVQTINNASVALWVMDIDANRYQVTQLC